MVKKIKNFFRSSIIVLKIGSVVYKNEQSILRIKKIVS